jgi:hypothetical protein
MKRLIVSIPLQHENAWSSRGMRILLHDDCRSYASNHFIDEYIIGRKLIIAMR